MHGVVGGKRRRLYQTLTYSNQYGTASDWSPEAWMFINRGPTGLLAFDTPIYEHDTPTFTVAVADPDGDSMNVQVESSYNGGAYVNLIQWSGVPSGEPKAFSHGPLARGTYTFRLTVNDGNGGSYQQTYVFYALPLGLAGRVSHTPEWESYRQLWNSRFPLQPRGSDMFWAGEAFVLAADVTDTGTSSTKPLAVTATLLATGESVDLTGDSFLVLYEGMLLNTEHPYTLAQGSQTFRFNVQWSNGLHLTYDVPIRIEGSVFDVIVNQIRH